jgi:TonB family protein
MSTPQHELLPVDIPLDDAPLEFSPSLRQFGGMLFLSLLLHLAVALYLSVAPRSGIGPGTAVFDVAITESSPPAPAMYTQQEASMEPEEPDLADPPAESEATATPPLAEVPAQVVSTPAPPSSLLFGISSGAFASFGDGVSLKDDIRPYFLEILERINASWHKEGSGVTLAAPAMLLVSIERNGELRAVQTLQSTGNPYHDRLLARAVRSAAPFPVMPASYTPPTFEAPLRFSPPLSLMSFGAPAAVMPPH